MANNVKNAGYDVGYNPTAKPITKAQQSAPPLGSGDTADNAARGNITLASEQKGILSRKNSGNVSNRLGKYTY